ncbi:MAG: UDP-N-acetylglucosamine 2-epimerase (non-hydrolyzing), partial [Thermoleophilia bacterium]
LMKTAPVLAELGRRSDRFASVLVHTGQHYDREMSAVFLEELGVGAPDHVLGVGSGTHAQQTARVMERLEPLLVELRPDLVLVPGDVNSTLAAALTAAKLEIPVAHLEAGLRSFDRSMPEELNRLLTDALAEVHLIHSPEARDNLLREGASDASIHFVGNTMIDTLVAMRHRSEVHDAPARFGLHEREYLVVTLHRPALVDGPPLATAVAHLAEVARELTVVFPVHPRTRAALDSFSVGDGRRLRLLPPLGYLDFLGLMAGATAVLTDSGGIQEETTALGIPCFTLRDTTERPITVELGTNTVLGLDPDKIKEVPRLLREKGRRPAQVPPLWDGHAAERVVDAMEQFLGERGDRQ